MAWPYATPYGKQLANDEYASLPLDLPIYPGAPGGKTHNTPSPLELFAKLVAHLKRQLEPDAEGAADAVLDGDMLQASRSLRKAADATCQSSSAMAGDSAGETDGTAGAAAATSREASLLASATASATIAARLVASTDARRAAWGGGGTATENGLIQGPACSDSGVGADCADLSALASALGTMHCALHAHLDTMVAATHPAVGGSAVGGPAKTLIEAIFAAMDYLLGMAKGMAADRGAMLRKGLGIADRYNFEDFLALHGVRRQSMTNPVGIAGHDLIFGYRHGNPANATCAAGVATMGILNMFLNYHGPFFRKFRPGTADVIFTPLYRKLVAAGVKFHFFHKATNLKPSSKTAATGAGSAGAGSAGAAAAAEPAIDRIDFEVQATVAHSTAASAIASFTASYSPLLADGTWPSKPLYNQLTEGAALRSRDIDLEDYYSEWPAVAARSLTRGVDFDEVVLGIPVGALPHLTGELSSASPRWKKMVNGAATVATQAMQLWLTETTADLASASREETTLIGFAHPYSTWADMSHVLAEERWGRNHSRRAARSLGYFVGALHDESESSLPPLTDHAYPGRMREAVKEATIEWLDQRLPRLWPRLNEVSGGVYSVLVGSEPGHDKRAAIETQYIRANVDPSARYVLPVPGGIGGTRLHPAKSTFSNMVLAGDWTLNGVNSGCAESAVTSGMLASRALVGAPRDDVFADWFLQFGPPLP